MKANVVHSPDASAALAAGAAQVAHDQETASLRATISDLLRIIDSRAGEKDRAEAFAVLVQQLQQANEHLVLAAFGAQDRQATAEAANLRQIEFLSMLAHELRNPMQPMAMANALLAETTGLHPDLARIHDVFARQIAHMARLVDDLLDASRVSCGKITLQLAPVLLGDILNEAIETSQPGIARRCQQLQVRLPAAPLTLEGDLVRLAQVFSNLLINASKFTPEHGHIALTARRLGDSVEVRVSDDGAGIVPELQPFIFDLFTQGFRSLERSEGGLGIGLSLVRTITQMHGGSTAVNSAGTGLGSTFIVTLPLSNRSAQKDGTPASAPLAQACRILLIEDNADANEMLTLLLQSEGHSVTSCFDGPGGLRAGLDQPFDVVLCDIGLPGMDGYQVVSALRAGLTAQAAALPCFVATTGYSKTDQPRRARETGFDHYLVKPVSMVALSQIIAARAGALAPPGEPRTESTSGNLE